MANPMQTLKAVKIDIDKKEEAPYEKTAMHELISRVFTTRNLLHFAHWNTKSYAAHNALGSLYDEIVSQMDEIVEVCQGKHGLLKGLCTSNACVPDDIVKHVKEEADWMCDNKEKIAGDVGAIENLLDELEAMYLKAIYKLENLS